MYVLGCIDVDVDSTHEPWFIIFLYSSIHRGFYIYAWKLPVYSRQYVYNTVRIYAGKDGVPPSWV